MRIGQFSYFRQFFLSLSSFIHMKTICSSQFEICVCTRKVKQCTQWRKWKKTMKLVCFVLFKWLLSFEHRQKNVKCLISKNELFLTRDLRWQIIRNLFFFVRKVIYRSYFSRVKKLRILGLVMIIELGFSFRHSFFANKKYHDYYEPWRCCVIFVF